MLKKFWSTPAHLYLDNMPYFITASIYKKRPLLSVPFLKIQLSELIREFFGKYNWELHHWVILDNHYHLIGKSRKGKDMSSIFKGIHSCSGISVHEKTHCEKPVWWNYWDYCPRNEKEYMARINYLLNNPVKHGYVKDLRDYPFSSFHALLTEKGRNELVRQFKDYPDYRDMILPEKEDDF
ncbi:MAG: hypothetical protein GY734_09625 [Herbaspirillum sp.]|nr:hypothetical protein [Herbaspirillum sp.]